MEKPVLTDQNVFPSDEVIFAQIGKNSKHWTALFGQIAERYPEILCEWRFYNDVKCWLMKSAQNKKTVFWLSVIPGTFRTTFYISAKNKDLVVKSAIADDLKKQYRDKMKTVKFPGITVAVKSKKDVRSILQLIGLKESAK